VLYSFIYSLYALFDVLSFCHLVTAHTSDSGLVLNTVHVINAHTYVSIYVSYMYLSTDNFVMLIQ